MADSHVATPPVSPCPNGPSPLEYLLWGALNPGYEAVVQATAEAVANALVAGEEMTGRDGHRSPALARERVAGLVSRWRAPLDG